MTSKTSFNSILMREWKNRSWLFAINLILCLLGLPTAVVLWLTNRDVVNLENAQYIVEAFPGMLNGNTDLFLLPLLFLMALLCGCSCFAHFHNRIQVDFYHSLPVKRVTLFRVCFFSGLLLFAVPYVIACVLSVLVAAAFHIVTPMLLVKSLVAMIAGILEFLVCYLLVVLGMMLTGRMIAGVLASCVLLVYVGLIELVAQFLFDTYFTSYVSTNFTVLNWINPILWETHFANLYTPQHVSWLGFTIAIVLMLVLYFVSRHLCVIRRSESAENSLAFPRTSSVIKIMITIPTALGIGAFMGALQSANAPRWTLIWSILGAILLCAVIEFIYTPDLRNVLNRKIASAISVVAVGLILLSFQSDAFGYNKWMPKQEDVASMSIEADRVEAFFDRSSIELLQTGQYRGTLYDPKCEYENFIPLYELAAKGIEHMSEFTDASGDYDYTNGDVITFRYTMKNGKEYFRQYEVTGDELITALDALYQDPDNRSRLCSLQEVDPQRISYVQINDLVSTDQRLNIDPGTFITAYLQDLESFSWKEAYETTPIASFTLVVNRGADTSVEDSRHSNWPDYLGSFYLYDSNTHVLDLLKMNGYTITTTLKPEDIRTMTYTVYTDEEVYDDGAYKDPSRPITDKEEQAALLKRAIFSENPLRESTYPLEQLEVILEETGSTCTFPLRKE